MAYDSEFYRLLDSGDFDVNCLTFLYEKNKNHEIHETHEIIFINSASR